MVRFRYQPWNEIVVHDVVKYPLEHFLSTHSLGVREGGIGRPLNWADGIIFEHRNMPPTEDIIKEQLEGKIHWNALNYGIMEEYEKKLVMPGQVTIPVINMSNNIVFKEMAKWIKETFEKNS